MNKKEGFNYAKENDLLSYRKQYIQIPYEILIDNRLNSNEKLLYSLILSFNSNRKEFYGTNTYIGTLLGISKATVQKSIKTLQRNGFIEYYIKKRTDTDIPDRTLEVTLTEIQQDVLRDFNCQYIKIDYYEK